ncbi:Mn2+/Fe2+ NRAMP family transporter [Spinactinospora alkalitolerans]|uniref:Mn2+/Fe2+ NRAMP family transporter n=1 Tax=Spinactinospora alkalitolerans TaxID=687207 RepID=A0A852U3L5_9ACTN|nr:Nramp family divalent metal transporter [Spinactinospora alkalitolerans]NYE50085.1 Mn2+/Fe2+ NRAMP family transporter [Spinactinospora alkalitolerans]
MHDARPQPERAGSATRRRSSRMLRALALMGPAFIVGAWQFGPGNLTSAIQAGGEYGYTLIWVIVISTALMVVFTDMSVRIGLAARHSLIETAKRTLGRWWGICAGLGVFAITLMFSVGNAVGAGLGMSMVFGGDPVLWTLACTAVVAALLFARDYYRVFERMTLFVVALMAAGFVAAAVLSRPDWGAVGAGFAPTLPSGVGLLLIALVGTNFSINAAFYAGYTTRERGRAPAQYREATLSDTVPGIVAPGIMTILVIVASAAVLQGTGGADASRLGGVLGSVAGPAGSLVFAVGFAGAAFSSMVANASAGGTLLSDALGWGNLLRDRRVKAAILLVLAFGAAVTAVSTAAPIELIIVAQALTVVVAPFLGLLILVLANHRGLMGTMRNRWWQNILGVIGWLAIAATCFRLVTTLL